MGRNSDLISEADIKEQVREFYDSVGWKQIGEGVYQNARYEDLREVSREYIHRCHLRVTDYLPSEGKFLLDAGSGPIQYPEYLEYSKGFRYRVCLDISILALMEARERIGEHGLFVVGDIANLPFKDGAFDGVVSLHTVHHLPPQEHKAAFHDLFRTLKPGGRAAVVYTWGTRSSLMRAFRRPMAWATRLLGSMALVPASDEGTLNLIEEPKPDASNLIQKPGTYTYKHDYGWVRKNLSALPNLEIRSWRSVSTAFLRALIHPRALGGIWLRLIYWAEGLTPHLLGRIGQYPIILFDKPVGINGSFKRELSESVGKVGEPI
ncbi:MAG: methyltransferase domain-containing protein [Anaerolineales bacterium]|nr:methyltransferase domain-containing protein [Anaerolineales bacterium]